MNIMNSMNQILTEIWGFCYLLRNNKMSILVCNSRQQLIGGRIEDTVLTVLTTIVL
jgi:hypothetical protein